MRDSDKLRKVPVSNAEATDKVVAEIAADYASRNPTGDPATQAAEAEVMMAAGYAALAADPEHQEHEAQIRHLRQRDWAENEGLGEGLFERAQRRTGGRSRIVPAPVEFSPQQAVTMLAVQQARRELEAVRSLDQITTGDIIVLATFILTRHT